MFSPRRALISFIFISCCFYFLYPRNTGSSIKPITKSKAHLSPIEQSEAIADQSKPKDVRVLRGSSQAQQRLKIEKLQGLPLSAQLEFQFPYSVESKFPKFIWQTWKYTPGDGKFEERFRVPEASWTEKHAGFVHEVITDEIATHLISYLYGAVPDVIEAYQALPLNILKADFFRYLILLARGGVYADIDTTAIKPAMEWLADFEASTVGLVIGIEADPERSDWHDWYSRRIQFCQWTIQSKPGHPVLRETVVNITATTLKWKKAGKLNNFKQNVEDVIEFSGPALWTDAIFGFFNNPKYYDRSRKSQDITWENFTKLRRPKQLGDVVVLPITSFSPGVGQMGAGEIDDPLAFVFHTFEGSWKPESERHIEPAADREQRERESQKAAAEATQH